MMDLNAYFNSIDNFIITRNKLLKNMNKEKQNGLRYWFVHFTYATQTGSGSGNFGIGTKSFVKNKILKEAVKQSPLGIEGSFVITNFIEMTEEDYNEFWGNK